MTGVGQRSSLIPIAVIAISGIVPFFVSGEGIIYYASLVLVWSIFAAGFDLAFGLTGLLSLGHAAFFGTGAMVHAVLMMRANWSFVPALLAGAFAAGALAVVFGILTVRASGVFLALTTQALGQMAYIIAGTKLTRWTGGVEGIAGVPRPTLGNIDFYNPHIYYAVLAAAFVFCLGSLAMLYASPFGQVLRGIRQNETRAAQLGFNTKRFKIAALGISGFYSGIAGGLLASLMSFVSPQIMQWTVSGDLLIMNLFGGPGTLIGPVLGVAVIEFLREELSAYTEHWYGVLGIIFVLCTILMPQGLLGLFKKRGEQVAGRVGGIGSQPSSVATRTALSNATGGAKGRVYLSCRDISVNYGKFHALSDITLDCQEGKIYGLIGPNGAGKTTLANVLSGLMKPTTGQVFLDGIDITGLSNTARARRGIGRSFQLINIFREMSVIENLRLGAQATHGDRQPFWRPVGSDARLNERAEAMLAFIGLEPLRHRTAGALSHGDQRALEIGLTLMTDPAILVLDEPLAGVGHQNLKRATKLVTDVAKGRTVILIEHNMDAIMALSNEIIVLVGGRVLAAGSPEEIRSNATVRTAYLGEEDVVDA